MELKKVGISILVVLLLVVLINSFPKLDRYTGKASTNIKDCSDSDNGLNPNVGGILIGSYTSTIAIKDFCVNSNLLGEYYCDTQKSDGKLEQIDCEFGCITEKGLGRCNDAPKTVIKCEKGCYYNEICVDAGIRIDGKYCDWDGNLKLQITGKCENSFECGSNFCVNKKCITEEEWSNFLKDIEKTYWWE